MLVALLSFDYDYASWLIHATAQVTIVYFHVYRCNWTTTTRGIPQFRQFNTARLSKTMVSAFEMTGFTTPQSATNCQVQKKRPNRDVATKLGGDAKLGGDELFSLVATKAVRSCAR